VWLPTAKGFYSPRNVKQVHAYGVAAEAAFDVRLAADWQLSAKMMYSWTPSINRGEPYSEADRSVGKQLPYIPQHTANITARLSFRRWSLLYKWCYYSRRYTMSSNDLTLTGTLPEYFMSNLSLERTLSLSWADLSFKGTINNLLDEEYVSILSHPMPGINFEIFVGITPKWHRRR
ncbi:MAG: TonB-dependent receptor, partial [Alistipes sp.]|nr:TonB-dependent receptor [Alistipes sp.]